MKIPRAGKVGAALVAVCLLAAACSKTTPSAPTTSTTGSGPHHAAVVDRGNVPASINDTCSVDDTKALGKWLYGLNVRAPGPAGKVANLGTGCYLVNGSLFLRRVRLHD